MGLIAAVGLQSATAFAATCAETPAAAMRLPEKVGPSSMPNKKGYRVATVRWDPLLQQSWATIVRCDHPEWHGITLRTSETIDAQRELSTQVHVERSLLIHAGDTVELWRQEDMLRIEVSGVAEQSGSVGETIRVRLLRRPGSNQSVEEQFSGVVRGRADVEMRP